MNRKELTKDPPLFLALFLRCPDGDEPLRCLGNMWLHPHESANRRLQRPKAPPAQIGTSVPKCQDSLSAARYNLRDQQPHHRPASSSSNGLATPRGSSSAPAVERPLRAAEGPFDSSRTGERSMRPPDPATLPEAMKYPASATAVPLPTKFDTMLVPASARPPAQELRRASNGGVCGYNGAGRASRAPNVLALPSRSAPAPRHLAGSTFGLAACLQVQQNLPGEQITPD